MIYRVRDEPGQLTAQAAVPAQGCLCLAFRETCTTRPAATATEVIICAGARPGDAVNVEVRVAVAASGPLVAMKLQSVMNRYRAKEATDLLDIARLTSTPCPDKFG